MFIVNQFGRFSAVRAEAQIKARAKAKAAPIHFEFHHPLAKRIRLSDRSCDSFRFVFGLLWFGLVQLVSLMVLLAHLIWFDGNTKRQFELTDCCLFTTAALYTVDLWNGFLFISAYVGTFFLSLSRSLFNRLFGRFVCALCEYYISLCCAVVAFIYYILMICFRNFKTLHRENLLRVQQNRRAKQKNRRKLKEKKRRTKRYRFIYVYMYSVHCTQRRIRTTPPDIK